MLAPITARVRSDWPGSAGAARAPTDIAAVAQRFEALIAESLLKSARAADLGDDGLGDADASGIGGGSGDHVRAMIDHARAEAIARAAPLGIARLLALENARLPAVDNARLPAVDNARLPAAKNARLPAMEVAK